MLDKIKVASEGGYLQSLFVCRCTLVTLSDKQGMVTTKGDGLCGGRRLHKELCLQQSRCSRPDKFWI